MKATKSSWFMEWPKYCDLIHIFSLHVILHKMHYTFVNNVSLLPLQEQNGPKTTCVLQDVTPGTYAIEVLSIILSYAVKWVSLNVIEQIHFLIPAASRWQQHDQKTDAVPCEPRWKNSEICTLCACSASVFALIRCCLCLFAVHSPWTGPIRAMAITVPLVIMSAFRHSLHRHVSQETARCVSVIREARVSSLLCGICKPIGVIWRHWRGLMRDGI